MAKFIENIIIQKSLEIGRLIVMGSSLISCSSNSLKRAVPNFAKSSERRTMRIELMRLWAEMEYFRLMGDEVKASSLERDYAILEREITKLELESENSLSSR